MALPKPSKICRQLETAIVENMSLGDWITSASTFALVVITGFYAHYARKILLANESVGKSMKEQNLQLSRPHVNIRAEVAADKQMLVLVIESLGRTSARNLRLKMDRSFSHLGWTGSNSDLASFYPFQKEIKSLPPNSSLIFNLGIGFQIFGKDHDAARMPRAFPIEASYRGEEQYDEITTIDLNCVMMSRAAEDIPLKDEMRDLVKSSKEISGNMALIARAVIQQRAGEEDGNSLSS